MTNKQDIVRNQRVRMMELTRIRNAMLAIDAAVAGMEPGDIGAKEGVSSWLLHTAHEVSGIIREMETEAGGEQ